MRSVPCAAGVLFTRNYSASFDRNSEDPKALPASDGKRGPQEISKDEIGSIGMPASRYFTAFCLYLNYMVHGIGVLIISLNMHSLEVQWSTDAAGVSVVISSLGLGRFALLYIAGTLSDRFGRKPFVLGGIAVYMAFFIGLLFTRDLTLAYVFGFLAGCANSLLDAGHRPRRLLHARRILFHGRSPFHHAGSHAAHAGL